MGIGTPESAVCGHARLGFYPIDGISRSIYYRTETWKSHRNSPPFVISTNTTSPFMYVLSFLSFNRCCIPTFHRTWDNMSPSAVYHPNDVKVGSLPLSCVSGNTHLCRFSANTLSDPGRGPGQYPCCPLPPLPL